MLIFHLKCATVWPMCLQMPRSYSVPCHQWSLTRVLSIRGDRCLRSNTGNHQTWHRLNKTCPPANSASGGREQWDNSFCHSFKVIKCGYQNRHVLGNKIWAKDWCICARMITSDNVTPITLCNCLEVNLIYEWNIGICIMVIIIWNSVFIKIIPWWWNITVIHLQMPSRANKT